MRISDWSSDVCSSDLRSCVTAVGDVAGSAVTTIEAIDGKAAGAVQTAWEKLDVVQCGYCQSGQVMSAVALLSDNPKPSDQDIDDPMSGNVCRCATYVRIRPAIHEAAKLMRSEEHTSELQSLMPHSYSVFCLKKKKQKCNITP